MAIKVKFDTANNPLPARLILATKAGSMIRELPVNELKFREGLTDGSEFSFRVYKNRCTDEDGNIDESFWRKIQDFRLAWCPEFNMWYELRLNVSDSTTTVKSVTAVSLGEAELSQINVYGLEINTEADIEREDYAPTVLFDPDHKDRSLVDRLLYKAPHWRIGHIDDSLRRLQRSFRFDGKTIYDCFQEVSQELDCLFVTEAKVSGNTKIDRTISIYDLESYCRSCGARGDFYGGKCTNCESTDILPGYGEDTSVFVSKENLAEEIVYETDTDAVKNCFRLEAGDELMTASIVNANPNGSQYIWYITDEMKDDMSPALRTKLAEYDERYDYYLNDYAFSVDPAKVEQYNQIVNKYISFKEDLGTIPSTIYGSAALMTAYYNTVDLQMLLNSSLMPTVSTSSTSASEEAAKLNATNLSPVAVANLSDCTTATAEAAILAMAKCLVRGSYQVKVNTGSYNAGSQTWTGSFTVTNYSDDADTANSATANIRINGNFADYTRQKLEKMLSQKSDDATDITSLFKLNQSAFAAELRKYSLQRLIAFRDACTAALDVLIQQGVANNVSWAAGDENPYNTLYLPYRQKLNAIESEILIRTQELAAVTGVYDENGGLLSDGMQSILLTKREEVHAVLDFEKFLGDTLWKEFASFRREDVFQNQNYISDGLTNEQLLMSAEEFLEAARKELYKSARLQHSITATLHNLLAMREFQPITDSFAVGNWIRVAVDGRVYRLRLREYTIDYDSWSLYVEFTDVREGGGSAGDLESMLASLRSMSTTYGAVARQAVAGKKGSDKVNSWVNDGFKLTTKIVGGAENQEFVMDETGFTGKELIPETGGYKDTQVKIISDGLYITDDGWLTAKSAIGRFTFYNPQTKQTEEAYGVIADKLVGNIVLSQAMGIYNENGSITLDENGFTMIVDSEDNTKVFQIMRDNGDDTYSPVLSIDSNGNLVLNAYSTTDDMNDAISSAISISSDEILTTVSETLDNYSTTEEINSAISQTADEILSTVSSTYITQNDAESAYASKASAISDVDVEYIKTNSPSTAPGQDDPNWSTTAPAWEAGKYIWQRTKTTNANGDVNYSNPTCIQGAASTAYRLQLSHAAIVRAEDGTYMPTAITLTAKAQTGENALVNYAGRFTIEISTDGTTWPSTPAYTSSSNESAKTYTIPAGIKALRCRLYRAGGTTSLLDEQTVPIVEDGNVGQDGEDAYTVILTNQNHTFAGQTGAALPGSVECEIVAYKGATPVVSTIGNITGAPTGMTVTKTNSSSVSTLSKFTVTVDSTMTTRNGTLEVPVTVDGKVFDMIFSYAIALQGAKGSDATVYNLIVSSAAIAKASDGSYSPTSITLNARSQTGGGEYVTYAGRFKIETTANGSTWTTQYTSTANESSKSYNVPANIKAVRCSLYASGGTTMLVDQQTVPVVEDGADGEDAYTVILSNENHSFAGDTTAALGGSAECAVIAYKGAAQVAATIGTITGNPTGMSTSLSGNGTVNAKFTVTVDTTMTTKNGTLTVPVTVDGHTFNKIFTYALALRGANGADGYNTATVYLYKRATSTPSAPSSALTYTFSTKTLSGSLGGWTQTIPDGENPVYVIGAMAASRTDTDSIAANEWSSAVVLAQNGEDGDNGLNSATVVLYQRADSAPAKPSASLTYTFSTGKLAGTLGSWSQSMPASNGKPCWVTHATAISTAGTDTIAASEWSDVVKFVEDGSSGRGITSIVEYYAKSASNSSAPADSEFTTSVPTVDEVNKYLWNRELITYTDSATAWTSKRVIGQYGTAGIDGVSITGVTNYYLATAASSGVTRSTSGWTSTVQLIDATNRYLWNYEKIEYSEGDPSYTDPTIIGTYGRDGTDGYNTASVYLYQRAASTPSKPSTALTYTFSTKTVTGTLGNWKQNIQSGTDPIYVIAAMAGSRTDTDTISTNEWSDPVILAQNGADGQPGTPGSNGLNTATVTLYQRAASAPSKPGSALTYTFATGKLTGTLGSWTQSVPATDGNPCWVTQATAISAETTDNIAASEWSAVTKLVEDGADGADTTVYSLIVSNPVIVRTSSGSYSTATLNLTAKSKTGTGAYGDYAGRFKIETTANGSTWTSRYTSSSNQSSYSYTIPSGITAIRCSLYLAGGTSTLLDQQIVPIATDGTDGTNGTDGQDAYTVLLTNENHTFAGDTEKALDSQSAECGVIVYKGATQIAATIGTITGAPTGMSTTLSGNGTTGAKFTVSVSSAMTARSGSLTVPITADGKSFSRNFSYSLALSGEDGTSGVDGYNSAILYLYQRAASAPSVPSGTVSYEFSTKTISGNIGSWSTVIPAGTDPVYVTAATASSRTDTDSIASNEWSSPVILAKNGTDGQPGTNGSDGLNTATVVLYQRADSIPSKPSSSLTYTFSTGALSGTLGSWSQSIPAANGNPCYITHAMAVSSSATDTIAASEWSAVVLFVEDGEDGDDGIGIVSIREQYCKSISNVEPQSTDTWSYDQPEWERGKYLWTRSEITWTAPNPTSTVTYTTPILAQALNDASAGIDDLSRRITTTETKIDQTTDSIKLMASEVESYMIDEIGTPNRITFPYYNQNANGTATTINVTGTLTATMNADGSVTLNGLGDAASSGTTDIEIARNIPLLAGHHRLYLKQPLPYDIMNTSLNFTYSGASSGNMNTGGSNAVIEGGMSSNSVIFSYPATNAGSTFSNSLCIRAKLNVNYESYTVYPMISYGDDVYKWGSPSRNILLYPYAGFGGQEVTTVSGVTFTQNTDGSITLDGTSTAAINFDLVTADMHMKLWNNIASGTKYYVLSLANAGVSGVTLYLKYKTSASGSLQSKVATSGYISTSVTNSTTYKYADYTAYLGISSGTVFSNLTVWPMLTYGSATHDFEAPGGAYLRSSKLAYPIKNSYNLAPYLYGQEPYTINGVTFTFLESGAIKITGTATATGYYIYTYTPFSLPDGQYCLEVEAPSNFPAVSGSYPFSLGEVSDGGWCAGVREQTQNHTQIPGATMWYRTYDITDCDSFLLQLRMPEGAVYNHVIYPQIAAGGAPRSWMPPRGVGSDLYSMMQITSREISSQVSRDGVISAINQTAEQITIDASKINLSGYVTISSLGAGGTTIVDGSRIHGGELILGGNGNGNGKLFVTDSLGWTVVGADNTGMKIYCTNSSVSFSLIGGYGPFKSYGDDEVVPEEEVIDEDLLGPILEANINGINLYRGVIRGPQIVIGGADDMYGKLTLVDSNQLALLTISDEGTKAIPSAAIRMPTGMLWCRMIGTSPLDNAYSTRIVNGTIMDIRTLSNNTNREIFSIYVDSNDNMCIKPTYTGTVYITGTGNLHAVGRLSCQGTKPRIVETENFGKRQLICYEMPSPMFGDVGGGVIDESGLCYIFLDPIFAETINSNISYYVFLQKNGDGDCYVSERHADYFVVAGTPGLSFSWELKAKQSDYDQDRLNVFDPVQDGIPAGYEANYDTWAAEYIEEYYKEIDSE